MRLTLIKLDMIGAICWLVMDMFWMWNIPSVALLIYPIISALIIRSVSKTSSKEIKIFLYATNAWLFMNACWIATDVFMINELTLLLKIAGTVAGILSIIAITLQFKHRKHVLQKSKQGNH